MLAKRVFREHAVRLVPINTAVAHLRCPHHGAPCPCAMPKPLRTSPRSPPARTARQPHARSLQRSAQANLGADTVASTQSIRSRPPSSTAPATTTTTTHPLDVLHSNRWTCLLLRVPPVPAVQYAAVLLTQPHLHRCARTATVAGGQPAPVTPHPATPTRADGATP